MKVGNEFVNKCTLCTMLKINKDEMIFIILWILSL